MKKSIRDFIRHTAMLGLGSAVCALAVNGILVPQGFLGRGLTGVALLVYHKYPVMSVAGFYLLMNVPVFCLGWRFVGPRFVWYSLWGMVLYTVMLQVVTFRIETSDRMLGAVIAGALSGFGTAVILRSYGSSGGAEILYVMMHKAFSITLGMGSLILNALVLVVSALLFPIENVLYTLIYVAVSAQVTNAVFHGFARRQAAIIMSDQWREITRELTDTRRVGITLISGRGAYHGTDRTILYSVMSRRNVSDVKKLVLDKDPNAFMAILSAEDVTGVEVGNQPHW